MEIWKDIVGYEGKYQISSFGNVRSFSKWKNGELLKPGKVSGYSFVRLVKTGRNDSKNYYIHRLVASHFLDNPKRLPEVNHIDGDKNNNCVDNLEWCTRKYNAEHASKIGILSKAHEFESGKNNERSKPVIQKARDGSFVKEWESVNQIQRETGFLASSIFCCCNNKKHYKTAYGYIWEYKSGKTGNKNKTPNP